MPAAKTTRSLERFLAVVGAMVCLVICLRVWQVLQSGAYSPGGRADLWPLPGLYLLQMAALGVAGMAGIVGEYSERQPYWGAATWAAVGALVAFAVLGAFTIGLLFFPVALIFAVTAVLSSVRRRLSIAASLGAFIVAGAAQVALMFAVIRLVQPNAVF